MLSCLLLGQVCLRFMQSTEPDPTLLRFWLMELGFQLLVDVDFSPKSNVIGPLYTNLQQIQNKEHFKQCLKRKTEFIFNFN